MVAIRHFPVVCVTWDFNERLAHQSLSNHVTKAAAIRMFHDERVVQLPTSIVVYRFSIRFAFSTMS